MAQERSTSASDVKTCIFVLWRRWHSVDLCDDDRKFQESATRQPFCQTRAQSIDITIATDCVYLLQEWLCSQRPLCHQLHRNLVVREACSLYQALIKPDYINFSLRICVRSFSPYRKYCRILFVSQPAPPNLSVAINHSFVQQSSSE